MKMRSQSRSAVDMSWVEKTMVVPCLLSSSTASRSGSGIHRVQSGEWLIKNKEAGLGDDGGHELDLLGHALRQLIDPLVRPILELKPLKPAVDHGVDLAQGLCL